MFIADVRTTHFKILLTSGVGALEFDDNAIIGDASGLPTSFGGFQFSDGIGLAHDQQQYEA